MADNNVEYIANESLTAWLSTAGSQIFFMQLGFLCYEVGFVEEVWAPSVILKNLEDTFVGVLVYLCFSHTLATSSPSLFGLVSYPTQPFLIGVDASNHEEVFIAAVFATTCATIISGAVLERMKNKAYIAWCAITILVNYSIIAHWIWNPEGWLAKLGYMDGAGSVVVHSTGAVAGLIAMWRLGPRRNSLDHYGNLKPVETAEKPVINAVGAFILWYGWFAFNISSPVAANLKAGAAVGTTALVTIIGPTCASFSALLMMRLKLAPLSYDNLLGAMLGGLVSITGGCFTVDIWSAAFIGFFSSPLFFLSIRLVRNKAKLDDPLQIVAVHLTCGIYACLMEGIFANDTMGHPGLIYGNWRHFLVQVIGTLVCLISNGALSLFLYCVIMERGLFRGTSLRVSILDNYLGVNISVLHSSVALEEILKCETSLSRQMLFQFHGVTIERFNNEQLDFLIALQIFRDMLNDEKDLTKLAEAIIAIIGTYVDADAEMCVNLSGTQRARLLKIKRRLIAEIDIDSEALHPRNSSQMSHKKKVTLEKQIFHKFGRENTITHSLMNFDFMAEGVFDAAHGEVFKIVLPIFCMFINDFNKKERIIKKNVRLPFQLNTDWTLEWDTGVIKDKEKFRSLSRAASRATVEENGAEETNGRYDGNGDNDIELVMADDMPNMNGNKSQTPEYVLHAFPTHPLADDKSASINRKENP